MLTSAPSTRQLPDHLQHRPAGPIGLRQHRQWVSSVGVQNIQLNDYLSDPTITKPNYPHLPPFLPDVVLSPLRTPGIVGIPVSSNPATTAANIEYAFSMASQQQTVLTAPFFFLTAPAYFTTNVPFMGPYKTRPR